MYTLCIHIHARIRGGPTLTILFLVDEGREDPNTTISGPSSTRQRNTHNNQFWSGCVLPAGDILFSSSYVGLPPPPSPPPPPPQKKKKKYQEYRGPK